MLNDAQYKCIMLMVEGNLTQKKIAEELKITEQTICNWKKDKEFIYEHETLLKESFKKYIPEARESLVELMRNAHSEMVKLNATNILLEKAGITPKTIIESKNENNNINSVDDKTADLLKNALERFGK